MQSTVAPIASPDTLFLRCFANPGGSVSGLDSLTITTAGIGSPTTPIPLPGGGPGPATVTANGPAQRRSLQVDGAAVAVGFTLTGRVRFAWTGSIPTRSNLAAQLKVGQLINTGEGDTIEEHQPRRSRASPYPAVLLPVVLAASDPDWSAVLPAAFQVLDAP